MAGFATVAMSSTHAPLKIGIVGAGPAGLALALLAARRLPQADITIFDARPVDKDVSDDPRALAMSLGSVQMLQRLNAWPAEHTQAITEVLVSQAPPTLQRHGLPAELRLRASDMGTDMLGAVLHYGTLVTAMQQVWLAAQAQAPQRLHNRFGAPVRAIKSVQDGQRIEIDAQTVETFDLAVVAEGGVFADQARKALSHDYQQTAWVGRVGLSGATPGRAVERFTRDGPVALLPLPGPSRDSQGLLNAALVWCIPSHDDPVAGLGDTQRIAVLNARLPAAAGRVAWISPLKQFALGLNAERSLVEGRLVRIGNAAQTLHPVAGQGLNLGLRDAHALVQALREAEGQTMERTLRQVELSRAPDRWSMIATTDFLARSFTWRWPGLPALRGLGLAALAAAPPLQRALAKQMMFGRR